MEALTARSAPLWVKFEWIKDILPSFQFKLTLQSCNQVGVQELFEWLTFLIATVKSRRFGSLRELFHIPRVGSGNDTVVPVLLRIERR